jgi:hypothetical protein
VRSLSPLFFLLPMRADSAFVHSLSPPLSTTHSQARHLNRSQARVRPFLSFRSFISLLTTFLPSSISHLPPFPLHYTSLTPLQLSDLHRAGRHRRSPPPPRPHLHGGVDGVADGSPLVASLGFVRGRGGGMEETEGSRIGGVRDERGVCCAKERKFSRLLRFVFVLPC